MTTETQLPSTRRTIVDFLVPRAQVGPPALPPPHDDYWYEPKGSLAAGEKVTGLTALTYSGCWAATNALAGLFGALPCKVYRDSADGREEAKKHEAYRLLGSEPNTDIDSFVFWEMMTQWWINYGNAFAEIQRRSDSDRLFALWPIHPTRVRPEKVGKRWTGRWLVRSNNATEEPIDAVDMLNIVGHLSDDGLIGKGVITYAAKAIGVGLAQQSYEAGFYEKGGRPTGVLLHKGTLSENARADVRREWRTIHQEGNEIAVLWEGMDYRSISVDPEHAKLMEAELGTVQDMCRFYDVPPHVLYELSKGTFANTEEMNRFLVSQPMLRRTVRVEKALDRQLFTETEKKAGYRTKFNMAALLRGTPKEQAEVLQLGLMNGVINQDEWRAHLELNKLPDGLGSTYWMKRDMAPIELVKSAAQKEIDKPAEIPETAPTPETPPTPPTPADNRARELRLLAGRLSRHVRHGRNEVSRLTARLSEELRFKEAAEQRWRDACQRVELATDAKAALESEIVALKAGASRLDKAKADAEASLETASAALAESRAKITSAEAERDDAAQRATEAGVRADSAEAHDRQSTARIAALEKQHDAATERAAKAETALKTAENSLSDAKTGKIEAEKSVSRLEAAVGKANQRGDEFKARVDALAADVGILRAERDTFRAQADALAKSRDESLAALADAKVEIEAAQNRADTAENEAKIAQNEAESRVLGLQKRVATSFRALLDESLQFLLAQEQHEVRDAARKPEQFKQITSGWYHSFHSRLAAQLTTAADTLEKLGSKRVDVAKIAADYVAESRTRLHNVLHATNRADLRVAVRKETETWEARRASLLDWIGADDGSSK